MERLCTGRFALMFIMIFICLSLLFSPPLYGGGESDKDGVGAVPGAGAVKGIDSRGKGHVGRDIPAERDSNVFTLGKIEVKEEGETDRNITVETITSEEMQQFNRDRITDALDLLPGVTISNAGGRNEKGIYVRGFSPTRVPVFLDGIPVYVPYDRTFDYNRFSTYDLSEIVVTKGFTSVLYGPNTMGGAINMVTRRPTKVFEGSAGTGYASGNTYHGYLNLGTGHKKWYAQAAVSYMNSDYYPMSNKFKPTTTQGGGSRRNSYSKDDKVSFKVGFTPFEGHEYVIGYLNQHGEKGQPPDTRPWMRQNYWQWPKWDKESLYFASNTPLGDMSYVKVRLYHDTFTNWLDYFTDITYTKANNNVGFGTRSYYDDNAYGGSIEIGTTCIPKNNLKGTFHYKRDTHRDNVQWSNIGTNPAPILIPGPVTPTDDVTISLGIEDTVDITENIYAIAGVSYDTIDMLRAKKWVTNPAPQVISFNPRTASSLNPQLGLFFKLSETGKLHVSAEHKSRFPTMKERYSWSFGRSVDNPGLKPEKAINYEIGYEDIFLKKIRTRATVFYNDITDAIQQVQITPTLTQNQNIAKLKQIGVEMEGVFFITEDLEGGLNGTYLNRQNDAGTINYIRPTDVPVYKVFSYMKYATPLKGLSVLGSFQYNSSSNSTSDGLYQSGEVALFNGKVSYEIGGGVVVEAGVNNIFDKNYQYTDGFPETGRYYFANMKFTF